MMIIRFPTALYSADLPQGPSDAGNVTYLISMDDPPRNFSSTIRLPPAIEVRDKPDKTLSDNYRRVHLGQRIFTISRTRKSSTGTGKKQFEVGQLLEFTTADRILADPMLVADLELRHDTNLLDLEGLGISDVDIANIESSAMSTLKLLQTELSTAIRTRKDAEIAINENKKEENETRKALASVQQLAEVDSSFDSVVDDLEAKLPVLEAERNQLLVTANKAASDADASRDKIIDLIQVVR